MAPRTTTTGSSKRYGTEPRAMRARDNDRRRDHLGVVSAVTAIVSEGRAVAGALRAVEDRGDVVARRARRLLHGELPLEDLREHVAEDIPVLDVDPVLRLRHEPALCSSALVHVVPEQVGRVRDVALRLERLFGARRGEVLDPVSRER